jgi:hypothetical protein
MKEPADFYLIPSMKSTAVPTPSYFTATKGGPAPCEDAIFLGHVSPFHLAKMPIDAAINPFVAALAALASGAPLSRAAEIAHILQPWLDVFDGLRILAVEGKLTEQGTDVVKAALAELEHRSVDDLVDEDEALLSDTMWKAELPPVRTYVNSETGLREWKKEAHPAIGLLQELLGRGKSLAAAAPKESALPPITDFLRSLGGRV